MMPAQELREKCERVIRNGGPQEAIDDIMLEAEGYRHLLRNARLERVLHERDVDSVKRLKGWLGFHIETMAAPAPRTTVNANVSANATAIASADLNQTMLQMWALPDSSLDAEGKNELARLLAELEASKKEDSSKVKKAAKAVSDWLFDKGIDAIPAVMPYVTDTVRTALGL